MPDLFYIPVFFVVFRETLETAVVVSVLLAVLKQSLDRDETRQQYKSLRKQIFLGAVVGFGICLLLGSLVIGIFYALGTDQWSEHEYMWEGVFALIASIIITLMGGAMLRLSRVKAKWRAKLFNTMARERKSIDSPRTRIKEWFERHAMFFLPLVTILREGLEAIIFVGGVSVGAPARSIPIPTALGLALGCGVGVVIYKGGNMAPLKFFLVVTVCFLYHIAAGLLSRAFWYFDANEWNKVTGGDAAETGSGPGSYDIRRSVWHVNCCNPEYDGGGWWGVFNSLLGWQNSATYGSVISYNLYWLVVILWLVRSRWKETKSRRSSGPVSATSVRVEN